MMKKTAPPFSDEAIRAAREAVEYERMTRVRWWSKQQERLAARRILFARTEGMT